nr:MAG TPA: hypothetical protein [Caudoviricetes sp.]
MKLADKESRLNKGGFSYFIQILLQSINQSIMCIIGG